MGKVERLTNGTTGGPVFVYVQDGRIIRITPIEFDESDAPSWVIEARGRRFTPPRKTTLAPYSLAFRSMIYSPKRLLYPLKRVDFDPNGKRNCTRRGESGYERIGWDEAVDIVTSEMKRIKREYGPAAMLTTPGSHHLWGNIGYRLSTYMRFMNLVGYTYADHNPDSWEGWHWGGMHNWGFSSRLGIPEQYDLLEDALKHTEMIVFWSSDPEVTQGVYSAFESTPRRQWLKELGVKMVFIDPFYNHTAAMYSDKWFAPRPDTGNAMACAIAFVWITEDLYDREYIETRTVGFEKWRDYILGKEDGVPKTPEWAEQETTIPAREIRALAREWASKKTMLAAGGVGGWGGACRAATGGEWARLMISLIAMQGLGKPGINIWSTVQGTPCNTEFVFPGYAEGGIAGDVDNSAAGFRWVYRMHKRPTRSSINAPMGQHVPRLKIPEIILDGKFEWRGKGFCGQSIEAQFHKYKYPADGYPEIQMYYKYGGSFIGTMNETNRFVKAYRTERLPFVVNQSVWFEGEAKFADIILPACTNFERWDISEFANCSGYIADSYIQVNHRVITLQKKCIEPLGESKSDYEIFSLLSKKLGLYDVYTEGGMTELDWVRRMFDASDLPEHISWDEFFEKGYFVVPLPEDYRPTPALRWFAEGRRKDTPDWGPHPESQEEFGKGLQTTSGLIEFESSSLKKFDPGDEERPVIPKYIPSWEGHHTTRLYNKYPLQMLTPHPKFSFHTMGDAKESFVNDIKDHRVLVNGYYYWIIIINSRDAEERGIRDKDLVRVFNDRGEVICAAQVTERVPPGTVHSYESCADYDPISKPGESPDRCGCVNILTPSRYITKNSCGQAPNSCLVQIEKY
ncbi:MAG: molybdopterin-dependent oxidoreductase [Deltaproteobacteria bacterium]|nr:molybdopterin-dependent oxidoreductase [Deltaproteobacteria bacterium]